MLVNWWAEWNMNHHIITMEYLLLLLALDENEIYLLGARIHAIGADGRHISPRM